MPTTGGWTCRRRLALLVKVCRAVEHAHRNGVIHRDLKPANILVADGEPTILDFGVARITDADVRATTLRTDAGQLVGTLAYMSPEQVAGDTEALDRRSDVYALGAILYELLSGTLPLDLDRQSLPEAVRLICAEDPVPLSSIDRSLRGDLDTIAAKALEKEPERRYPSAAALADDIERHLRGEPIAAKPPSVMDGARRFARRHPAAAVAIIGAFAVLLSTVLVFMTMYGLTRAALGQVQEANRRAAATARDLWASMSSAEPDTAFEGEAADAARQGREEATRAAEALNEDRFGAAAESYLAALADWRKAEVLRDMTVDRLIATVRAAVVEERRPAAEAALARLRVLDVGDEIVRPLAAEVDLLRLEMVEVPGGTFAMGEERHADGRPVHEVTVRGFLLAATEVTRGQYLAVTGRDPSIFKDSLEAPVENVTWFDAVDFCNRLSARRGLSPCYRIGNPVLTTDGTIRAADVEPVDGTGYRLPSEAEWEYACRAGTTSMFSFGDLEQDADEWAWHKDNSRGAPRPVATKRPNAWKLYDMHGNVWEWCADLWHAGYEGAPTDGSAWLEPGRSESRLLRGGCWADLPFYCRSAYRRDRPPGTYLQYRGFRVARERAP